MASNFKYDKITASKSQIMNQKWRNIWIRDMFCSQHLWCRAFRVYNEGVVHVMVVWVNSGF